MRLNWLANIKLKRPGPPGAVLFLGAYLNWGTLNYFCRGPFKLVGKNEIEGAWTPRINIIVNYCCTRVLLYAKMLTETETEETIVFFVTFLSLVAFQVGGGGGPGPLGNEVRVATPGYAYAMKCEWRSRNPDRQGVRQWCYSNGTGFLRKIRKNCPLCIEKKSRRGG